MGKAKVLGSRRSGKFFNRTTAILFFCSLSLTATVIAKVINFSKKDFKEPVDTTFWERNPQKGVELVRSIDFGRLLKRPHFHLPVNFDGAIFDRLDMSLAAFDSQITFSGSNFWDQTDFYGVTFYSATSFKAANFHQKTNFQAASFNSNAEFYKARFDSIADFTSAHFASTADFEKANFKAGVDFSAATLGSKATFKGAQFLGNTHFFKVVLPHELDFRDVRVMSGQIDFYLSRLATNAPKCKVALYGSDISKIKLNMNHFDLWFPPDTVMRELVFEVSPSKPTTQSESFEITGVSYDDKASVYEMVLKKLKDDGLMDSYKIVDIQYRQFKYKCKSWKGFFFNLLDKCWWNYGYDRDWILRWTSLFWILFFIINFSNFSKLSKKVYKMDSLDKMQGSYTSDSKKWMSHFIQVAIYTSVIFFGLKMDLTKFSDGVIRSHPWWLSYLILVYTIGIVCIGFTVNYIFKL